MNTPIARIVVNALALATSVAPLLSVRAMRAAEKFTGDDEANTLLRRPLRVLWTIEA